MAVSLVSYSSSSESLSSDTENEANIKRTKCDKNIQNFTEKNKFRMPSFLRKSYGKPSDDFVIDCPDKHDGRIRSFEHVRGNWASFVYINVILDFDELKKSIQDLFSELEFKMSSELHISLTKTLVLQHHWIDEFSKSIIKFLREQSSFRTRFGSLNVYTNKEGTRTFIGLTVEPTFSTKIKNLTDNLDQILEEFRLEKFYSKPLYHTSILWCNGNHKEFLQEKKDELKKIFATSQRLHDFEMEVDKINLKIGNKYYSCNLKS